jgi:hypothetical protein
MPQKPDKLLPALYGGIIIGVISGTPLLSIINCLCCAGILFGGLMSVFFYKKDLTAEMSPLTSADGMQLGALAGVFGAIVNSVIAAVLFFTVGNIGGEMMLRLLSGFLEKFPQETVAQLEDSIRLRSFSFWTIIGSFITSVPFGLLGGLIGYALFKQKGGAAFQTPPQPPFQ